MKLDIKKERSEELLEKGFYCYPSSQESAL